MKLTKTVKICYFFGTCIIVISLFFITYKVSLLEWEMRGISLKHLSPEIRDRLLEYAKTMIYPYQTLGLILLWSGVFAFIVLPTIISQIGHEIKQTGIYFVKFFSLLKKNKKRQKNRNVREES